MPLTRDTLLAGRLLYAQPGSGHRTSLEPVLLAAAVPARAGERVLEAGCGAGAGLLCLASRVPGIAGLGVEREAAIAALAAENFRANGFDTLAVREADIEALLEHAAFDHAFANPPWHREAASASPDATRDRAKRAPDGMLEAWVARLVRAVKPGGTVTLILPAALWPAAGAALLGNKAGALRLLPLWPRAGEAARLCLIGALKGRRGDAVLLPGMALHEGKQLSAAAEHVLRDGGGIALYGRS